MPFFFDRKKRILEVMKFFLILFVAIPYSGKAQDERKFPDSVIVSDTARSQYENSKDTLRSGADTATDTKSAVEDSVVLRKIPDSVSARLRGDKDFAYANDPGYWIKAPLRREKNFFDYFFEWVTTKWFRGFVFVFLSGILLYALYKIIIENRLYMFYSSPKRHMNQAADETESVFDNLDLKIRNAASNNDFRSALRYLYLKALRLAGDEELIRFHAQGTNAEYIQQLTDHPQGDQFRFLTSAYEFVWYGGFELKQDQFELLQKQFEGFYKAIRN
jgi:hypothetical protein